MTAGHLTNQHSRTARELSWDSEVELHHLAIWCPWISWEGVQAAVHHTHATGQLRFPEVVALRIWDISRQKHVQRHLRISLVKQRFISLSWPLPERFLNAVVRKHNTASKEASCIVETSPTLHPAGNSRRFTVVFLEPLSEGGTCDPWFFQHRIQND